MVAGGDIVDEKALAARFGEKLRALRLARGLVQEDVGAWFNMRKSTVSQWESGRLPHPAVIAELARRFGVSTDYLLELSDVAALAGAPASRVAEEPADYLPREARERIEEFTELMRLKYGKKQ
jgi:transcriptional regulator with XRE-family HTH domain